MVQVFGAGVPNRLPGRHDILRQKCNDPRNVTSLATYEEDGPPRRAGPAGRTLRVAPAIGMQPLLGRFGVDLAPLLFEVGLPPDSFDNPENRLPVDRLLQLLALAAERSDCPHLGMLLAEPMRLPALGNAIDRLLSGALSVERALRGLIMNLHLNGEALVPALAISADEAVLSITPYAFHERGTDQLEDYALTFATNLLRSLCGPRWSPIRITFAHREPVDRRPHDAFFRAPVAFGGPISAVCFDPAWLQQRPVPSCASPAALPAPEPSAALDVAVQARRAVIRGLAQGVIGVDSVADALGLSRRTLNRRLAERGTSTKELIAEVRLQVARQLLLDTDLTVADIAVTTCYSDVAAFSRAFSAGVGQSPAAWRRRPGVNRGTSPA